MIENRKVKLSFLHPPSFASSNVLLSAAKEPFHSARPDQKRFRVRPGQLIPCSRLFSGKDRDKTDESKRLMFMRPSEQMCDAIASAERNRSKVKKKGSDFRKL